MYAQLFNAVTDAIQLLQQAQADTEEVFISQEEAQVIQLRRIDNPSKQGGSRKE
jgi:hypothetical protein